MTHHLVYVSSAARGFDRADLDDILAASRRNNAALGVSGALLHKGGNLMQVLEGDEAVVRELYGRIARDPRHHGLITLLEGTHSSRQFADWSMAFGDLDVDDPDPALSDFLSTPVDDAAFGPSPSAPQRLLLSFKRNLSRG